MASTTYDPRRNRLAVFVVFGVQGFAFSLLVSRVPALQKQLGLDDGTLSILLAVVPIVAGIGSVLAGYLTRWVSSSVLLRIAQPCVLLSLVVAPYTKNLYEAMPLLGFFGLWLGAVDATMNMQGVGLQRRYGRSIILGFHSLWAAGAIVGSGFAALGAGMDLPLSRVYLVGVIAGLCFCIPAGPSLLRGLGDETIVKTDDGKVPHVPWRPMILLCAVMTLAYIGDSTVNNGGGVYLTKGLHSTDSQSALVVGAYTFGLLLGRVRGDVLVRKFGGVPVVRAGSVVGVLGMIIAISAIGPWMAIGGFFVVGLGLSVLVPQAFAAADRCDPAGTGVAIARINVFNYVGFLLGAPLVTTLWQAGVPYRMGLILPAVLIGVIALPARGFDERRTAVPASATPLADPAETVPTLGT